MRSILAPTVFAALLALTSVSPAVAQTGPMQTISNPAGYRYQVPASWIPELSTSPAESAMTSADQTETAYVMVASPAGGSARARLRALMAEALMPAQAQLADVGMSPSSAILVPGADLAAERSATYTDASGTPVQEYVIAAINGTAGYILMIDLPSDTDAATPDLAQSILGSFQLRTAAPGPSAYQSASRQAPILAPASAAMAAAPGAPVPLPSTTSAPAPTPSSPAVVPLYASDFNTGIAGITGIDGTQVSQDTANAMFGSSHSLKVVTRGLAPIEGAVFASATGVGGQVYTMSAWVTAPAGATLTLVLAVDGVGSFVSMDFSGTGAPQYVTITGIASGSGPQPIDWAIRTDGTQAITYWVSMVQVQTGATATPFTP